jgi:TP901 family phage tail tape measure protein
MEIFKLFGRIVLEGAEKVTSGLDAIDNKVKQSESGLNKFAGGMENVGKGISKAGAGVSAFISLPAAGALAFAANAATTFEHAVDQVGAVAQATGEQMQGLSDKALKIGKDTAFGATEAAGAMEVLAANGVSVDDIINGAADAAVALAAAGGTTLAKAADTASTAMAVWGLKAEDMLDVVNRTAGAANVSRFGVEDMSAAIAQGGGAAATAGVEYADFATSIAATAQNFSSGSDAGTSFKTFLNGLSPSTKEQKKLMRELGLVTADGSNQFYDAAGNLKSMAEVSDLLHNATAGLTEQQKLNALQTLFGNDAMRTAAGLSNITGAQFEEMSNKMRDTDAQEVAAQRMGNLKGGMEQLGGAVETLSIQFGQIMAPVLSKIVTGVTGVIGKISDLPQPIQTAIVVALAFLAGLGPLLLIFGQIATAIGALIPIAVAAAPALAGFWAALMGPIGIVIALLAAFGLAYATNFLGFRDLVNSVIGAIKPVFDDLIGTVKAVIAAFQGLESFGAIFGDIGAKIDELIAMVSGDLETIKAEFLETFNVIAPVVEGAISTVVSVIGAALGVIIGYIQDHKAQFEQIFGGIWQSLTGLFEVGWAIFVGAIRIALAALRGDWGDAWEILKETVGKVLDGLGDIVEGAFNTLMGVIELALGPIIDFVRDQWERIKTDAESALSAVGDAFTTGWETIKGIVEGAINFVVDKLQWLYDHNTFVKQFVDGIVEDFNNLKATVEDVWNAIRSVIETVINAVVSYVAGEVNRTVNDITVAWGVIRNVTETAWETVRVVIAAAWQAITSTISEAAGAVGAAVESIWSGIRTRAEGVATDALAWGSNIVNNLITGIRNKIPDLGNVASEAAGAIARFLGFHSPTEAGPGKDADKWGPDLINMMADGIRSTAPNLAAASEEAVGGLLTVINEHAGQAGEAIQKLAAIIAGDLAESGTSAADEGRELIAVFGEEAVAAYDRSVDAIGRVKNELVLLNEELDRQELALEQNEAAHESLQDMLKADEDRVKSLEGAIKDAESAIKDFGNATLKGSGKFSQEAFENEQAIKRVQLQILELEQKGTPATIKIQDGLNKIIEVATPTGKEIALLKAQVEALQQQGQKIKLTESLELDPLRRQLEQASQAALGLGKELTFDEAKAAIAERKGQIGTLWDALDQANLMQQDSTASVLSSNEALIAQRALVQGLRSDGKALEEAMKGFDKATQDAIKAAKEVDKTPEGFAKLEDALKLNETAANNLKLKQIELKLAGQENSVEFKNNATALSHLGLEAERLNLQKKIGFEGTTTQGKLLTTATGEVIKGIDGMGNESDSAAGQVGGLSSAIQNQFNLLSNLATQASGGGRFIGWELVNGMIEGVNQQANSWYQTVQNVVMNGINAAKRAAGIASPSKLAIEQIGIPIGEGIGIGAQRGLLGFVAPIEAMLANIGRLDPSINMSGMNPSFPVTQYFNNVDPRDVDLGTSRALRRQITEWNTYKPQP